ncbi:MAG: LPS export ABC transporter permease LptF [bacterium]|nr:LPS export ABC transporter permease LptF [bacterium]
MLIIDRYILREFTPFFVLSCGVATFVLMLDKLFKLGTFVLGNRLSAVTFLQLLGYILATVGGLILPIAFLIASILTWGRLSSDHEYVVMKSAGLSLYRLLAPLLGVAVVIYITSSMMLMYGAPWGSQRLRQMVFEVARRQAHYHLRPKEFHDAFRGLVLYVERTQPERQRLEGIFIADTRTTSPQVITAQVGKLIVKADILEVVLRLHDGAIHVYAADDNRYYVLRFRDYDIRLELDTDLARRAKRAMRPRELFPVQIRDRIARQTAGTRRHRRLVLFWHKLFALPFACIIFAGLGPLLGVVQTRSGRTGAYILGLGAIFVYYMFLAVWSALGEETAFPPLLAAWLPNICMTGLTVFLLRRTA